MINLGSLSTSVGKEKTVVDNEPKDAFNKHTGFCLVCPITSTKKDFATYIGIKDPQKIAGEVVTHQLRSVDYTTRNIEKIEQCDMLTWIEVVEVTEMFI